MQIRTPSLMSTLATMGLALALALLVFSLVGCSTNELPTGPTPPPSVTNPTPGPIVVVPPLAPWCPTAPLLLTVNVRDNELLYQFEAPIGPNGWFPPRYQVEMVRTSTETPRNERVDELQVNRLHGPHNRQASAGARLPPAGRFSARIRVHMPEECFGPDGSRMFGEWSAPVSFGVE